MDEKGVIVELKVPSNPNHPEAPSIAIEIRKETYVPLYDLQGNITNVSFSDIKIDAGIKDSLFAFKIPKGVEVIEIPWTNKQ